MEKAYRNINYLFLAVLTFIFAAFFKTYFGKFPFFEGTTTLVHFHVAMVLSWFAMLIIQPILIRIKRVELHRLLGKISYFFVPLLVLSFVLMTRNEQLREKHLGIFTINIFDVSIFILFYVLGINYKRNIPWHIRFMVLTVLPFISPAAARLQLPGPIIQVIIILGLLIFERFKGKVYKPYVIALISYVIFFSIMLGIFLLKPEMLEFLWEICFS